ncbi:hypothetical protein [Polyangium mundeleinium]|uniref:WG repeat-containing protein n=1 Tax=Polyangium mundeleinium TaxID=2995306 RepID=A0ABT5EJU0_9BACT|nr:hypothetical protein [Polyangium mundeleinium]MDC0742066.1 hypothetical protein [Polyangium mundeleinium]
MLGRLDRTSLLAAALALGACTRPAPEPAHAKTSPQAAPSLGLDKPLVGGARLFHTAVDESFWVSHEADRDRLVSAGVRFELGPESGEVLAAAWDVDLALKSDPLLGALAVAPHLGGGFVHWSRTRVFRSDTFTGPMRPVAFGGARGFGAVRGARSGLDAVLVFGEAGTAALRKGSDVLEAPSEAGLADFAALDAKRAARVDFLGRLASTGDGGATWNDAASVAGIGNKMFLVQPGALAVDTWQGRLPLGADGRFGPMDGAQHGSSHGRGFEPILPGSRADDRNAWWIWRDTPPIQAAVLGGARVAAGRALAMSPSAVAEVDLAGASILRAVTDFPQPGLMCSAVAGPEAPLVVCGWEMYQDTSSYVMRLRDGALPPVVEKAFSDDGYFVTDDAGALAFVGSCKYTPRLVDPNDPSRMDFGSELRPATRICVRRGPDDWVEHAIELPPGQELYGWAPRRDGTAVALVVDPHAEGLPEAKHDTSSVVVQGGVRIVRVPAEVSGMVFSRPSWSPYGMYSGNVRGPLGPFMDRRFQAREDGSLEGWVASPNAGDVSGVFAGVVVDPHGRVTTFPPPPRVLGMSVTGDFGLAITRDGDLYETIDHGRSFQAAGRSPLPPASFGGFCSPLGCVIGPVTRLGWGSPGAAPVVYPDNPVEEPEPEAPMRLTCTPNGKPEIMPDAAIVPDKGRLSWQTGLGNMVTLVREVENVPGEEPGQAGLPPEITQMLPPEVLAQLPKDALQVLLKNMPQGGAAPPAPGKTPPRKASAATLRTHSLLMRALFEPGASPLRIDATSADLENTRRVVVTPLLTPKGDVGLLFVTDKHELVVTNERVATLPLFEPRRYTVADAAPGAGLLLGPERALVLGEIRRRMTIEEHAQAPLRPPVFVGQERDTGGRRPMTLARRDDGAIGILLWDGSPPRVVAVAEIDPATSSPRPRTPLASWTTATPADDPRCKKATGWRALVPMEPSAWLGFDPRALPGVSLRASGAALVRWTEERVCVEAIDVGAERRLDDVTRSEGSLVVRWEASGSKRRGAVLQAGGLRQELTCKLEPTPREQAR